jgi:hypothetical protein
MKPNKRLLQLNYYYIGEGPPPASTPAHTGEEREGPSGPDLERPEERGSGELERGKGVPSISILFQLWNILLIFFCNMTPTQYMD